MNSIARKVERYISDRNLLSDKVKPVIVGLSGGADSTALVLILLELGYKVICAHCNFHLRGEESDRDATHAKLFAEQIGISFNKIDFDIEQYLVNHKESVEEACRTLRYSWFAQLKNDCDAQKIAVGHNANDNIETFLFNLQRGTGLTGLKGIPPVNDRDVVRPLLCLTRIEIEEYLKCREVYFVTDSSNLQSDYSRNKLRNIVIPCFRAEFPNVDNGVTTTIVRMEEVDAVYRQFISEKKKLYVDVSGNVNLEHLVTDEPHAELLIYEWFKAQGMTRTQARNIIDSRKSTGARFDLSEKQLIINRGKLSAVSEVNEILTPEKYFTFSNSSIEEMQSNTSNDITFYNGAMLEGDELYIRHWQKGDRIKPFGMNGTKKVSDIFNDAKVSGAEKNTIPLLCKGKDILWVAGLRRSAHYTVSSDTTNIIKVEYLNHL